MIDAVYLTEEIMNSKAFDKYKGDPINFTKDGIYLI